MNPEKEKLLNESYQLMTNILWYDEIPIERISECVVDDVMGYGTTKDEKILDISALRKLINDQRIQGAGMGIQFDVTQISKRVSSNEKIAVFVDEIIVKMNIEGKRNEIPIRLSTIFEYAENKWKVIHFHTSSAVESEGDTWHKNEWKRKNEELQKKVDERTNELKKSIEELKSTQAQLIQSEKMASLGELTAGIAHEIQNPLNFVNNFSEVNIELIAEMKGEIEKGNLAEIKIIADDIAENEQKINHHGKRADAIVKGMLQHSRISSGIKEPTDINNLMDEYLRLAYHGLRAKDKTFNVTMKTDFDKSLGRVNVIPQDVGRVILNLITNAFYAVDEKKKKDENEYKPTVTVSTKNSGENVEIKVADNGNGISPKNLDKIFQPFFTTKPTGQGTGLGLSLSYDIIKVHNGELKVETAEGKGTEFTIQLPL